MEERLLTVHEVGCAIGVSYQSIGSWYKFKRENPESEYSAMLPEFVRIGGRNTRYWKESDIPALKKFHEAIPVGRNGVLGSVTQRYAKKSEKRKAKFKDLYEAKKAAGKRGMMIAEVTALLRRYDMEDKNIEVVLEVLKCMAEQKKQGCA